MSGKMEEPKKGKGVSGLVFATCLFLGLGIGIGLDYMPAALFIGMAVGFLAMAILRLKLGGGDCAPVAQRIEQRFPNRASAIVRSR